MKKTTFLILTLIVFMLLNSCTAESHDLQQCINSNPKGFWFGLWHGMISPIIFIVSLFNENIEIYESNNNGGWYNFGYIIGCGMVFGGGSSTTSKN